MNETITTPAVYAAIARVQAHLAKDGIDDVYNALATPMAEAGLVMLPRVLSRDIAERTSAKGSPLFYVVVEVEYDLVAASDGSRHTVRVIGEAMDSADKATNKAMSAAYKYAVLQTFCVPTEGENDADATTHEVAARPSEKVFAARDPANAPTMQLANRIGELIGPKGLAWKGDQPKNWLRSMFGKVSRMDLTLGQQQDAIALLEAQVVGDQNYEELLTVYRRDGRVLPREKDMGDIFDAANP